MASPSTFYGQQKTVTGKCVLISQDKFCVQLQGFSEEAVNIFKTIPSRSYDPKTRLWSFLVTDYKLVYSKLQSLGPKVIVERLPLFVLQCISAAKKEIIIDFDKLDPVLSSSLLPFQVEGLRFGIDKEGKCLIADDMGLGKTFQALAMANYYREDWPLLIVTTASMKTTWEETITNYMPSLSIMNMQYMVSAKDFISECKVLIVSHTMMKLALDKLLAKKFGVIIIDESHVLKSCKSKNFEAALQLTQKARRVILLSGTPALSRPSELYTQLSLINKQFFGTFHEYSKRYCDGKYTQFGWDASGSSNLQELEIILNLTFMIRRTKDDVLKALPDKKQEIITLKINFKEFSVEDEQLLTALNKKYNQKKGAEKHSLLLTFFSETAKIKIPAICSYILQIIDNKVKFLVFAHHKVMLDAIENVLQKKNIGYIRIDGSTTAEQRKFFISKFQHNDSCYCALLSITAANAGITLTAAQLVLFAELHWNPSIISQAESRAHRIGQENKVTVRYLLAPGTADDSVWSLLQDKQRTLNQVGLCKDNFEEVAVKKQTKNVIKEGLDVNATRINRAKEDIRMYLSPDKKRKIETENEIQDLLNDGLDEAMCKSFDEAEELFNDGLNELLCDMEF